MMMTPAASQRRPAGLSGARVAEYDAKPRVTTREMSRAYRLARRLRRRWHAGHRSPNPIPLTNCPQRAQGTSAKPLGNCIAEFPGGRRPAQAVSYTHLTLPTSDLV